MSKFSDHLWQDLVREHGAALAAGARQAPGGHRLLRRPRALAGASLGVAGVGTALALVLGVLGSPPAYAVTTNGNGSVTVQLNEISSLPQANDKLASLGTGEAISIRMAQGASPVSGPITCAREPSASGPPVQVLVGTDGTEVIPTGNTGAGTWHLAACAVFSSADAGNSGNTGTGNAPLAP
jgi:hypothetical protein